MILASQEISLEILIKVKIRIELTGSQAGFKLNKRENFPKFRFKFAAILRFVEVSNERLKLKNSLFFVLIDFLYLGLH